MTDEERLDFVEQNPRAVGLRPKWIGENTTTGERYEWIDIREMIDRAITESMRPKTVTEEPGGL